MPRVINLPDSKLRQLTCGRLIKLLGTNDAETRREILNDWGYGHRLSALSGERLVQLFHFVGRKLGERQNHPGRFEYTQRSKRLHAQMKRAGWTTLRARAFMLKHYSKSHFNLLDSNEYRQMTNMFKTYTKKKEEI